MRKANRKNVTPSIERRLEGVLMSEHDRQRAIHAIRSAEAIVDGAMWVKERVGMFGATLLKPVLKH
jgi:hypothetical protein